MHLEDPGAVTTSLAAPGAGANMRCNVGLGENVTALRYAASTAFSVELTQLVLRSGAAPGVAANATERNTSPRPAPKLLQSSAELFALVQGLETTHDDKHITQAAKHVIKVVTTAADLVQQHNPHSGASVAAGMATTARFQR